MAQVKWQVDLTSVPAIYNARNVAATVLCIAPSHRKLFRMLAPTFPITVLSQDIFNTDRTRPDSNEFNPFLTKFIKNDTIVIGKQVHRLSFAYCLHSR